MFLKFHNLELGDLIGVRETGYHFVTATVNVHTPLAFLLLLQFLAPACHAGSPLSV